MAALLLDNRTHTVVQVVVSIMLCVVMAVAWRTQKTYPVFGRWTASKLSYALGWLLVGLRGLIPDWASVFVANGCSSWRRFCCMKAFVNSAGNRTTPSSIMR
jgi:hypothetical protein